MDARIALARRCGNKTLLEKHSVSTQNMPMCMCPVPVPVCVRVFNERLPFHFTLPVKLVPQLIK